jgi:hypothetical protein
LINLKTRLQETPDTGVFFEEKVDWPESLEAFADHPGSFFPGLQGKPAHHRFSDLLKAGARRSGIAHTDLAAQG